MHARRLEVEGIDNAAKLLSDRVHDRFPDRGLSALAQEIAVLCRETGARLERTRRPHWILRSLVAALLLAGALLLVASASRVRLGSDIDGIDEWLAVIQNGIQDVVFLGIAVAFLVTIEGRLRRRETLAALHELRSVAHVIDMHQMTKDPDSVAHPELRTEHSPPRDLGRFALSRYLDYCSEMLALTSKLAALYAQESTDTTVLAAVREIEDLVGALSSKIWQKMTILEVLDEPSP